MAALIHNLGGNDLAGYRREGVFSQGDAALEARLNHLLRADDQSATAAIRREALRGFERDMPRGVSRLDGSKT